MCKLPELPEDFHLQSAAKKSVGHSKPFTAMMPIHTSHLQAAHIHKIEQTALLDF